MFRSWIRCMFLGLLLTIAGGVWAQDLGPGDVVPDCSKIPLLLYNQDYDPQPDWVASLESLLPDSGMTIIHFLSPRAPRRGPFKTYFVEELSALTKAAHSLTYPCTVIPVVPFGDKGRADVASVIRDVKQERWATSDIYYEPTYPRPGLYRTFRPGAQAGSDKEITTSWTYLIGPDRTILSVRAPGEDGQLYEWLQANLPEQIEVTAGSPTTDLSVPMPAAEQWPMFRRTMRHDAVAEQMADRLPYTYLAWQQRCGPTFASPAVYQGRVYVSTHSDGFRVLSLQNGDRLDYFGTGSSLWTSPAVAGDHVYTVSAEGTVYALNRLKLDPPAWKCELGSLATSSPAVAEGRLFVGTRDGNFYAIDAATGDVLWKRQTGGEASSSPALANGMVIVGSGDRDLYALDAKTGKVIWVAATGAPVDSSPLVDGNQVFVGSFDGWLYCFDLRDGSPIWRSQLDCWVHSSPIADDNTVFAGTVNIRRDEIPTFNWIDRKTGEVKGQFVMPNRVYSSPTIWGDLVLIGCKDGQLYAFDRLMRQTQPVWTFKTRGYVHASPVIAGDTLLIASYDGSVYALRQSQPIQIWTDKSVAPRWFMAALCRQLHEETGQLVVQAAKGEVGQELSLTPFENLFKQIRGQVLSPGEPPKVLPRDVPPEHPGAPYAEYVLTAGLLGGYPDGTFRPSEPATRYQFSSALASVLEWVTRPDFVWRTLGQASVAGAQVEVRAEMVAGRAPVPLTDVPSSHWAAKSLSTQNTMGLLQVDEEGRFMGNKTVTLGDAREQWELIAQSVKVVRTK